MPFFAEVEAADELAHDDHVDAVTPRRAEIRVDAELPPQSEQSLLGTHRLPLELREPHGCKQHGVGLTAGSERLVRERRALREDRVAAERMLGMLDSECVEHPDRLGHDLGPDAVAR